MSPEGTMNGKGRLHLPSPERNAVSPLKKYEDKRLAKRRKVKRWSLHEEDTLRTGVQKYVLVLYIFCTSLQLFL
jgi:hypothetical protein